MVTDKEIPGQATLTIVDGHCRDTDTLAGFPGAVGLLSYLGEDGNGGLWLDRGFGVTEGDAGAGYAFT